MISNTRIFWFVCHIMFLHEEEKMVFLKPTIGISLRLLTPLILQIDWVQVRNIFSSTNCGILVLYISSENFLAWDFHRFDTQPEYLYWQPFFQKYLETIKFSWKLAFHELTARMLCGDCFNLWRSGLDSVPRPRLTPQPSLDTRI